MNLKNPKASVLVFSLIVLFIGISAAIGIASSTLISQRSSLATSSSVQSFQLADSGSEIFLNRFKAADSDATLGSLGSGLICTLGTIRGNIGAGREYEITAYDISGNKLACNASLSSVDKIKSIGNYKNTSRAVEVAVAAGECKTYSGSANVGFNNGSTTSSMALVAFSGTCSDPIIVTQSVMDSVSCTVSSADLNSYISNVNQNGFNIYLSAECVVGGLPNGNSFGVNWIATCGSCD